MGVGHRSDKEAEPGLPAFRHRHLPRGDVFESQEQGTDVPAVGFVSRRQHQVFQRRDLIVNVLPQSGTVVLWPRGSVQLCAGRVVLLGAPRFKPREKGKYDMGLMRRASRPCTGRSSKRT
jgi:hypothetical protein